MSDEFAAVAVAGPTAVAMAGPTSPVPPTTDGQASSETDKTAEELNKTRDCKDAALSPSWSGLASSVLTAPCSVCVRAHPAVFRLSQPHVYSCGSNRNGVLGYPTDDAHADVQQADVRLLVVHTWLPFLRGTISCRRRESGALDSSHSS